jgi:hypothetical protein
VFVALGIQNAIRTRYIVICGLPVRLYSIFIPHYLIKGMIFEKKKMESKICFDFSKSFVWNISHSEEIWDKYDHKL